MKLWVAILCVAEFSQRWWSSWPSGLGLLLPFPSELTRHKPVLRLDQTVMPAGSVGLVSSAFKPLVPQKVELFTLLFEVLGSL